MHPLLMFGLGTLELVLILFVCFLLLVPAIFWLIALIDILQSKFNDNDKLIWFIVVFFLPVVGTILYYVLGKKQKVS